MSEIKDAFSKVAAALRTHGREDIASDLDRAMVRIEQTVNDYAAVRTAFEAAERAEAWYGEFDAQAPSFVRWLSGFRAAVLEETTTQTEWTRLADVPTEHTVLDTDDDRYEHNGIQWVRNGYAAISRDAANNLSPYGPFRLVR